MELRPLFNTEITLIWLPFCYSAETTQIWCYHNSNFKFSKISIWHYDHSNMMIPQFHIYIFSSSRKILKEYLYTVKIILNSDETLLFRKGLWSWKYSLFWRDIHYRSDYLFKTFLNSEGTLYRIGTKVLRTLLFSKRQKNEMRRRIAPQHKSEG